MSSTASGTNIFKLGDVPTGFLQVLLPEFTLAKEEHGLSLRVVITDDMSAIVSSQGKREFFETIRQSEGDSGLKLTHKLTAFFSNKRLLSYCFDCSRHPLRYGNGGVLPVVRLNSEDYFCLFYRDIFPIGWNIANGASDTTDEMLNPERIILREFGEELFICDHDERKIYAFDPGDENVPPGFQRKALEAWEEIFGHGTLAGYERLSIPMKWITGPDRIQACVGNRSHASGGYFLNITPEDNAIEVDRIAMINLKGRVSFFDGEYPRRTVLNRIVGLFKTARMKHILDGSDFHPDLVFFDGQEGKPGDLQKMIAKYLRSLGPPIRSAEDKSAYRKEERKFDLCPITRAMVRRYLEWALAGRAEVREVEAVAHDARDCQVFISYKSADIQVARWLYQYLTDRKHRVFCSAESLARLGESNYAAAIDKALDSATCLVVLGTKAEHFHSGWVDYEWRSFLNEIRAGRKERGKVFSFAGGVELNELPLALRSQQVVPYSPSSPQDSFENLYQFLKRALEAGLRPGNAR